MHETIGPTLTPEPYHPVRANFALARISNGEVPSEFCRADDPNVPTYASSIELWAVTDPIFAARLTEAKRIGALVIIADCIRIASDRSYRPDERKIMIDVRQKLAAFWNADCNPKTVVEQNTTIRNITPRSEYVEQAMLFLGMTRGQAEAEYQRQTGDTVQ